MPGILESSAFAAALVFGFRHGFDWDHIAALTDLTGSQTSAKRSMYLATLYALGHAVMVLILGLAAILFAQRLPGSVDSAMERFVGATLIVLGLYLAWTALHNRGAPVLRSRWMLLLSAITRVTRRWRSDTPVVLEHSHPHDHRNPLHADSHPHRESDDREGRHAASTRVAIEHRHAHQHRVAMPSDPFMAYGTWSSLGVGMLHGVGVETPTQLLIFAAAANATSNVASAGLLFFFVLGVLGANTVVAAAGTYGFKAVSRRRIVMRGLSILMAVFSLVVGGLLLAGGSAMLPSILGN